jgi:hypothetical protein
MIPEFKLARDVHNYPTWAMDIKINLTFWGMFEALTPLGER